MNHATNFCSWIMIRLISSKDPLLQDSSTSFWQAESVFGFSTSTQYGRTTSTASWFVTYNVHGKSDSTFKPQTNKRRHFQLGLPYPKGRQMLRSRTQIPVLSVMFLFPVQLLPTPWDTGLQFLVRRLMFLEFSTRRCSSQHNHPTQTQK